MEVSHRGLKGKRACHWLSKALEFYRGQDLCLMREGLLPSNASHTILQDLASRGGSLSGDGSRGGGAGRC